MRKIKFPLNGKNRTKNFCEIFYEFSYYEELKNLYYYSKRNNNYTILEKYLDLFKEYMDEIIDYADEFFCISRSNGLMPKIKSINHCQEQVMYDEELLEIPIYNIKSKKDKDKLKKIISYNLLDVGYDNEIIDIPNKSYLRNPNKKHRIFERIYFIKNNENFFRIELDNGRIKDYRSEELYYEHIGKYNVPTKERIKLKQDFYKAMKESIKDNINLHVNNLKKEPYSEFTKVYCLFHELSYNLGFDKLLRYCRYFNDYTIIEKYLDLLKKFLDDMIDYSDEFEGYGREDSMKPVLDRISHRIEKKTNGIKEFDEIIYNIKEKKYKDILKDNLSFNICVCGEEADIIPINRKYLRNDERNIWHDHSEYILFLKDNKKIFSIDLDIGEMYNYLKPYISKEFLDKYNNNSKERIELKKEYIRALQIITIEQIKLQEEYYRKEYSKYVKK